MTEPPLPHPEDREPRWVDRSADLADVARRVEAANVVALDTEANSMHAYQEQTCIVQLTVPEEDSVIDALAFENLDPLRDAIDRPDVEVVMHGGDYDVSVLTRDFAFCFHRVFDTMIAATILGRKELGLAALVRQHFDVELDKRFQRADWARRPVTDDQMDYLRRDTIYLPQLRAYLGEQLQAAGLTEVAEIEFRRLARRQGKPRVEDPDAWRRIKGAHKLDAVGRCVLRSLHLWREDVAKRRDLPPFKVLAPRSMLALAAQPPRRARHPKALPFLGHKERARHGKGILAAVQKGLEAFARNDIPPAKVKRVLSPEATEQLRHSKKIEERIRAWRRDEAAAREVPNLVVLPNPAMEWIARERPRTLDDLAHCEDVGPERIDRYGETLLKLVKHTVPR